MKTMKDFYAFSSKNYLTTFAAFPVMYDGKYGFDDGVDRLVRGEYDGFSFPIPFIKSKDDPGKKFRDVLDMRYPAANLISDRMKTLLEENQITGWQSYPIELCDRKNNRITGYNGFSIIGRAGRMDYSRQPIIERDGNKYYAGGYFDIETWDGSDFFMLKDSRWVIVTKRVVDLLKANKVTELLYEQVSKLEIFFVTLGVK